MSEMPDFFGDSDDPYRSEEGRGMQLPDEPAKPVTYAPVDDGADAPIVRQTAQPKQPVMNNQIISTDNVIKIDPTISGVDISGYRDSETGEWVVNDGYNSARFEDKVQAIKWIEGAIDFYSTIED